MTNTQKEVKKINKVNSAPTRKAMIEKVKTVAIVALVVGLVTFIGGIHYQQHVDAGKQTAVNDAVKIALTVKN